MLQGLRTGENGLGCLPFCVLFVGITLSPCLLSGTMGVGPEGTTLGPGPWYEEGWITVQLGLKRQGVLGPRAAPDARAH